LLHFFLEVMRRALGVVRQSLLRLIVKYDRIGSGTTARRLRSGGTRRKKRPDRHDHDRMWEEGTHARLLENGPRTNCMPSTGLRPFRRYNLVAAE
jgi:hypothetical protein